MSATWCCRGWCMWYSCARPMLMRKSLGSTPPQRAIAIDRVCWQGEAVAAVVATSRAVAEDAAEIVSVEYQELDAVTDMRTALDPETPVIHSSLGDNLAFERNLDAGAVDQ